MEITCRAERGEHRSTREQHVSTREQHVPGPGTAPRSTAPSSSPAAPATPPSGSRPGSHPPAPPATDTVSDVVRWAAFSCVLVPVVLLWYGTSLAGAAGTALGLAAVTGA